MIKFKRDKDGQIIAINEKGETVGTVSTMGDDLEKPKQEAPDEKVDR